MLIPVNYRVQYAAGPTPGSVIATPQLINDDGTVLMDFDQTAVKAGESLLFGPFQMKVEFSAASHHGKDVNATPGTASAAAQSGPKPGQQPPPRR